MRKCITIKVVNEDEFGRPSIFQFLAPKNITIEQLRDKAFTLSYFNNDSINTYLLCEVFIII